MDQASYWEIGKYNEAIAAKLAETNEGGWAVTAMFYAALHYVNGHLGTAHIGPNTNHDDRNRAMSTNAVTARLDDSYKRLKRRSEASRYEGVNWPREAVEELRTKDLQRIKSALNVR